MGGFGGGGGGAHDIGASGAGGFGAGNGSSKDSLQTGFGGSGFGGAIFNLTGTLKVADTTFYNNTAQGGGSNSANRGGSGFGGAVFNLNGNLTIINSTIISNTVLTGTNGISAVGSIYSLGDGDVRTSEYDPARNLVATASLTLYNTSIISTSGGYIDCIISTVNDGISNSSGSNNLIENNVGCATTSLSTTVNLPVIFKDH